MDKKNLFFATVLLFSMCQFVKGADADHRHTPCAPPYGSLALATGHIAVDAEELRRLKEDADQLQYRRKQDEERQHEVRHRTAGGAIVPTPVAPPQRDRGHHRERSLSNPDEMLGRDDEAPPLFTHFGTNVKDGSLELGLKALDRIERNAAALVAKARIALQERSRVHQEFSATSLSPALKPRKGFAKALNWVDPKEKRLKRHLDAQVTTDTERRGKSARAFNFLLSSVIVADGGLSGLGQAVELGAEKAAAKHDKLRQRTHLHGHGIPPRRRTISEPPQGDEYC
jgi:hypothetical protein